MFVRRIAIAFLTLTTSLELVAGAQSPEVARESTTSAQDRANTSGFDTDRSVFELVLRTGAIPEGGLAPSLDALAARIGPGDALVAWWRYSLMEDARDADGSWASEQRLCAFVVRRTASGEARLARVDLGPLATIAAAVEAWRAALGVSTEGEGSTVDPAGELARGEELHALVLDPLRAELEGAERIVVALADVLHGVPLDALPAGAFGGADGGSDPLGVHLRCEVRASLLELLEVRAPVPADGILLAFGDPAFDREPRGPEAGPDDVLAASSASDADVLRGGSSKQGFGTLPESGPEVRAIRQHYAQAFGLQAAAIVLEHARASRESLFALAPPARWLHVATHGWFAGAATPTSLRAATPASGMSPLSFCGLALAGANLPAETDGRPPGLVTAEELATLDLGACELAVLAAGDTHVGLRLGGRGVASLQKALHMAGARTVITSLWRVPDEATRELMVDFYRRIRIENKAKSVALWEAKMKLRDAKDDGGRPLYSTRDWAAWVLTGEPDCR